MSDHKLDLSLDNTGKLISILKGGESDRSILAEADLLIQHLGDILSYPRP